MSIRNQYESELKDLKMHLIRMGADVESSIRDVIDSLVKLDQEKAARVIKKEKEIGYYEALIEKECFNIMLRQQPVARDFREVSAALKIITDLERIGHQASDVAELVMSFKDGDFIKPLKHIPQMADITAEMVVDSVSAYVHSDTVLASEVFDRDDELDELFITVTKELVELMKTDDCNVDQGIVLMMIAKYFERIGDHAANICDWVMYYKTGRHIKRKYEIEEKP